MESVAYLRKGKVGVPKQVTLKLENDKVTINGKEGTILETPLSTLTEVGQGMGFIAFKVNNEYYSLEFIKPIQKMFGLIGLLFAGKGKAAAKTWRQTFEAKGITVKKQFM